MHRIECQHIYIYKKSFSWKTWWWNLELLCVTLTNLWSIRVWTESFWFVVFKKDGGHADI
jgi:hypothetical protein